MQILTRVRQFGVKLIYSKHMLWGLALASFLEATIVPIPLEAILIPLLQARRDLMLAIAGVALAGCLVGAVVGYGLGYFLFAAIGDYLISLVGTQEQFEQVRQQMQSGGFWFVFSVGVVPIPFQIAMLAAGALQYSLPMFLLASGLSRSLRYFGLAALVWIAGNQAQELFEKHKIWVSLILLVLVLGGWWLAAR